MGDRASKSNSGRNSAINLPVAVGSENYTKPSKPSMPSKPQRKRGRRLRKSAESPAAPHMRVGLAKSQHATCRTPEEVYTPSKGTRRYNAQGSSADLQSQTPLRQHAAHEEGEPSKGVGSIDIQPRVTLPVATLKVEAA